MAIAQPRRQPVTVRLDEHVHHEMTEFANANGVSLGTWFQAAAEVTLSLVKKANGNPVVDQWPKRITESSQSGAVIRRARVLDAERRRRS